MATLKSIDRSATVAFAPMASIMAVGTMAGAIDPSFSSAAALEILQLDFANTGQELPVLNSCATSERFNRLSWGKNAYDSEEYALGIIAGGLVDGSVNLWNPAKLVSGDGADPADSLLAQSDRHSGAVRGLEFSVLQANLLASGGDEGDLYIWDLKVPTTPNQYPPLRAGSGGGAQGQISYLSWNRKVATVLAATSNSGTSVVWDLRKQKPVLSFTDPNSRRRCSTLQWHPDNATQLVVASDDDRSPSLQVWDLRNSVSPLRELVGHSKGVLAMAWCPMDSSLLLTCAKDQLTLCWDTVSGEVLCELPASNNWNFDVQWSPRTPGVLSTSSFDGNVSIYNIEACSRAPSSETSFGRQITGMDSSYGKKAPKWLKRPVGVSYGFGGKLVTFKPMKKLSPGEVGPTSPEISLHSLVTEDELVKQSADFESAIAGGEKPVLRAFCDSKAETAGIEDDKETWRFLKVMFEDDARRKLLTHLNFEVLPTENELQETEEKPLAEDVGPEVALVDEHVEGNQSQLGSLEDDSLAEIAEDSFFDNLQTPRTPPAPRFEDLTLEANANEGDSNIEYESGGDEVDESEEAVQRALVVGDFKVAVQHCLAASRIADALILAYVGGSTLWEATQNEYIKKTGRPYLKILSAVVNNDLRSLVEKRPLKAWKETLAILCTYARSEDWTILSDALAARLDAAHESQAATLCYICSGNIEKAAEIWSRSLETAPDGRHYIQALQIVMEKVVVLSLATGQKRLSTGLGRLVTQYADLLVSQGLLQTAQEYLSLVPADQSSLELAELQHRIHGTGISDVQREAPAVPWEVEPLRLDSWAPSVEPSLPIYPPATYTPYPQNPYPGAQPATDRPSAIYPPQDTSTYTPLNFPHAQPTQQGIEASTPRPGPYSQPATGTTTPRLGPFFIPSTETTAPYVQPDVRPFPPPNTYNVPLPFVPQQTIMLPTTPGAPRFMPSSPKLQPPTIQVPPTPQSPHVASTPAPVAAPAPAPTIQNVDTSSVAGDLKGVVVSLTRLYNETSEAFGGSRANPAKRREIDNNSRKLGALFSKLNNADLSANASSKLIQLCQALDIGDYATALQIQVGLTTSDWDECGVWLAALKQMIKIRQTLR